MKCSLDKEPEGRPHLQEVHVKERLIPRTRVTLCMGDKPRSTAGSQCIAYKAILSSPREAASKGLYWGYQTRIAPSLFSMVSDGPFEVRCFCMVA